MGEASRSSSICTPPNLLLRLKWLHYKLESALSNVIWQLTFTLFPRISYGKHLNLKRTHVSSSNAVYKKPERDVADQSSWHRCLPACQYKLSHHTFRLLCDEPLSICFWRCRGFFSFFEECTEQLTFTQKDDLDQIICVQIMLLSRVVVKIICRYWALWNTASMAILQ